ncbi:MAG: tetratricopeptide repeat protein [Acidobacteriaceae bacterium]|nr:tetratricopeptide repeat protein [Acidobacteriaceae bacterium]
MIQRLFGRPAVIAVSILGCALLTEAGSAPAIQTDLAGARDRQDLNALDGMIARAKQAAEANPKSADAQYQLALAYSYAAEVAMELHDKRKAAAYAEAGVDPARKAVADEDSNAEYHRLLGAVCGQVIPANPLLGALSYGKCAQDEINRAIELNKDLALAYVSRGVGDYYLPQQMGGGLALALQHLDKAISLDPKLAEAYLWKGVVLRKSNRDAEARQAFERALQLDPNRLWAKQQLQKTPAQ